MATELEDHNEGQKDGIDATFMETLAVEWNPFLSSAYKKGFRHAVQQQSKRKVQEESPDREDDAKVSETRTSESDEDAEGMPWVLSLLFAFFVIIISGAYFLLRWIIQRPWRVVLCLCLVAGGAVISWQTERNQGASLRVTEPPASASPTTAEAAGVPEATPQVVEVTTTPPVATQERGGFAFLGEFSNEVDLNAHFDPEAEPRPPYRVELWKDERVGLVGHLRYPVREADSPTARLQDATFDEASGRISFQARIWAGNSFPENQPQYDIHAFEGILRKGVLQGTFSRQDESMKYAAVNEDVTLKQDPLDEQSERFATLEQWEAEHSRFVMERWR